MCSGANILTFLAFWSIFGEIEIGMPWIGYHETSFMLIEGFFPFFWDTGYPGELVQNINFHPDHRPDECRVADNTSKLDISPQWFEVIRI